MPPRKVAAAAQRRVAAYPATLAGVAMFWTMLGAYQLAQNLFGG